MIDAYIALVDALFLALQALLIHYAPGDKLLPGNVIIKTSSWAMLKGAVVTLLSSAFGVELWDKTFTRQRHMRRAQDETLEPCYALIVCFSQSPQTQAEQSITAFSIPAIRMAPTGPSSNWAINIPHN